MNGNETLLAEHLRQTNPLPPRQPRGDVAKDGWFYVIQAGGAGGPIKLGVTLTPAFRLAELQVGNHLELRLLHAVSGGMELERRMHRELSEHCIRGEWFRPTLEVKTALARVLTEPGRVSFKLLDVDSQACSTCGTLDCARGQSRCAACEEFAAIREAGGDPFEDDA